MDKDFQTGNSITGSDSATLSSTDTYSMTQTATGSNSYTLNETGTLTSSGTETANTVTGAYSLSQNGSDTYTLTENGQATGGSYSETVTGSETNTLTETGNTADQTFSRTESGSGSYTLTDSGPGATLTNGNGSYSYSLTESGDWKSGSLSQTEIGQDRYGLLQGFANVSNAAKGTPGNLDYSPFGLPFSDDAPKEGAKEKPANDGSNLQWISQDKMKDLVDRKLAHDVVVDGTPMRVVITPYGNVVRAFVYKEDVNPAKGGVREWAVARTFVVSTIDDRQALATTLKNVDTDEVAKRLAKATQDEALLGAHLNSLEVVIVGISMLPGGGEAEAISRGDYVDAAIAFAGDVALVGSFFVKLGAKAAAARGGARAIAELAKANKALGRFRAVEGAIALTRIGQAGYAIMHDDKGKAAAYIGEAILRIFGVAYARRVSPANLAEIKLGQKLGSGGNKEVFAIAGREDLLLL